MALPASMEVQSCAPSLLHHEKQATATALIPRSALRSKSPGDNRKEGPLTTYCELVNYFLETKMTDKAVAKTNATIMSFTELPNEAFIAYAKLILAKVLRCNRVYNKYILKDYFIEGL